MNNVFKIGALSAWTQVPPDAAFEIDVARRSRRPEFTVNTTGALELWAAPVGWDIDTQSEQGPDDDDWVLVGAVPYGIMKVSMAITGKHVVQFRAAKDTAVFVRHSAQDQTLSKADGLEKFTSIEPIERRSSDVDRLMYAMQKRDAAFQRQLAAERDQRAQDVNTAVQAAMTAKEKADEVKAEAAAKKKAQADAKKKAEADKKPEVKTDD